MDSSDFSTNSTITPRTPEILNSLMSMANHFDDYHINDLSDACQNEGTESIESSKLSITSDSSCSSVMSPFYSKESSASISIQQTCSRLIKASLKLSIEAKQRATTSFSKLGSAKMLEVHEGNEYSISSHEAHKANVRERRVRRMRGIRCSNRYRGCNCWEKCDHGSDSGNLLSRTMLPEDTERRHRRRERNKIAATKCRMKKREQTSKLMYESEVLETQNIDLKKQIQKLREQHCVLVEVMRSHKNSVCYLKHLQNCRQESSEPFESMTKNGTSDQESRNFIENYNCERKYKNYLSSINEEFLNEL